MAARGTHCPSNAPGSHWDSRTSRSVYIQRLLASNNTDPPPWARFSTNGQGQSRVFVAQPLRKKERRREKSLYSREIQWKIHCCPHQTFPTPQASAKPVLDPLSDSPLPSMSPTTPHKQDSSPKSVGKQLCLAKQSNQLVVAHQMLLGETQGPQQVNEDSSVQPGCSILYYQPFNTTDLLNCKHHNPVYSDKPQAMTDLLESTFHTISLHGETAASSLCLSSLLKKGDTSQQKPQNGSKDKSPQSSKM